MNFIQYGDWKIYTEYKDDKVYMRLYHKCSNYKADTIVSAVVKGICYTCKEKIPNDVKSLISFSENFKAYSGIYGKVYEHKMIDVLHEWCNTAKASRDGL